MLRVKNIHVCKVEHPTSSTGHVSPTGKPLRSRSILQKGRVSIININKYCTNMIESATLEGHHVHYIAVSVKSTLTENLYAQTISQNGSLNSDRDPLLL